MKLKKLLETHNLHDSLLERAVFACDERKVILEVDFCRWMQEDYRDGMPEKEMLRIIFEGVTAFRMDEHEINSDSIVKAEVRAENSVCLTVCSDKTGGCYTLTVTAENAVVERI